MPSKKVPPSLVDALLGQPQLQVFESDDADEVRDKVGQAFKPHRFELLREVEGESAHSRLHQFSLGKVSLHRLRYAGEANVDPDRLEEFFLVQMPLAGRAGIQCDQQLIDTDAGRGVVINPSQRLKMRYRDSCDQLMLRIDRAELEQVCSHHLGHPLKQPLVFDSAFNWLDLPAWRLALEYVTQVQKSSPDSLHHRLVLQQLQELLINTLLSQQPNNYTEQLAGEGPSLAPRHVKRVEEYIEAHAEEALTPSRLAEIGGVSLRTLYAGFHEFRQIGPIEYLRTVRLHRVRDALLKPAHQLSVTDTALAWGFTHMGRFSKAYQQQFGEKPSETLRRVQE
ncbi:AraC family transcriptional regulator [Marinobacterium sp. D7]|uniref:AraC family transcriptional regulator n=1 Tax=Marinobacterium ramblicola TaxID=2849041 RepID=UPI001C2D521F|nr:AraC family transcriptional regulator [Marinobacterium ramblicola]MBV1789102.1 AraC family transcriptional regulator [Marinobacterium ramblicola]